MLISPDNDKTKSLCPRVVVVDETGNQVKNVYSFDTETKEAGLYALNEKGQVRVLNDQPVIEKSFHANWKVFDIYTKEEVL